MNNHDLLNGVDLGQALNCGEWVIYGVKKANRIFAQQGKEALIFTGRFSTPALVRKWIKDHPDFVANHYLAPVRKSRVEQGSGARGKRPQRQPAAV